MSVMFDDFENDIISNQMRPKPLWEINLKNEEELLKWASEDFTIKSDNAMGRNKIYIENLFLYKGVHFRSQDSRDLLFNDKIPSARNPKIVANFIYDNVESRVSKLTRYRPSIFVMPANDEFSDKVKAKVVKMAIDSRWYTVDIDGVFRELERMADIYGEGYLCIEWDKDAGEELPANKRLRDAGETKEVVRQGDIVYRLVTPDRIYPEKRRFWCDVNHYTEIDYINVDELKKMYPKKADDIKEGGRKVFDLTSFESNTSDNDVMVMTITHKKHKFLPKGAVIKCTMDTILEVKEYDYPCEGFPFVRQSDIDVVGELHGRSFIGNIKQQQRHYNAIASMIARNHNQVASPKWVAPKGTIEHKKLDNGISLLEYRGAVPPQLMQLNPTSREFFDYMDKLEEKIGQFSGIFKVSRGEPPAGVKSGIALQFLDEQENERATTRISKRNTVIVEAAKRTAALMGEYYLEDDERMIRILGKGGEFLISRLENVDLSGPHDIRIQKASALPESRVARTETIINIKEAFPNLIEDELVLDLLDLSQDKKFKNIATANVNSAEAENEMMLQGESIDEPQEWEDHIIHYRVHVIEMQSSSFKKLPQEIKAMFVEHITATEYLMWQRSQKNPLFAQQLLTVKEYPIFFSAPTQQDMVAPVEPKQQQSLMPPGQMPVDEEFVAEQPVANVDQTAASAAQ